MSYTKAWCRSIVKRNIIRTPKGMTYRVFKEESMAYSHDEMWNYINREGGIWE